MPPEANRRVGSRRFWFKPCTPSATWALRLVLALLLSGVLPAFSVDRWVTNKTQFTSAMSVVQPGDVIIWKNGILDSQSTITFEPVAQGTANAPITLRAETPGGVTFRGNSQFSIGGHYLVMSGFRFDNSSFTFSDSNTVSAIINFRAHSDLARHAYNCRVTDCVFTNYDNPVTTSTSKWIEMYGGTNRFDHNFVSGKVTRGALLIVELSDQTNNIEAAHSIDNNVFDNRPPGPLDNEYETVRVGTSSYSDENAHVVVASNYFHRCSGEAEIVSNKSCENTYRYNTFVECSGSLTLRHGRGCRVEGNLFFGNNVTNSGGIRVCNQDHVIINNLLQDLAGTSYQAALAILDGTTPTTNSNPDLSGSYVQVDNVILAHNTLVNVADPVNYGVGSGGSGRTQPPRDITLAGNIISASNAPLFTLTDTPINVTNLDNIVWGAATGLPADPELVVTNPLLALDFRGLARPATNSPAVGAAGTQTLLNGDLLDLDGALRPLTGRDIGADEVGLGTRPPAPLSAGEVGPSWMQSSLNPNWPPGGNFDLSHWKLTLPIDSAGTNVGEAIEKSAAQLTAGFTNQYFYTAPDGAMVFWCPVTGATTGGSSYPRSELRELLNPANDNVNWTGNGTHILEAQCSVNQVPSTGKVIIGQIHGFGSSINPLVKLVYSSGSIYALVHRDATGSTEDTLTLTNVALNGTINYQIKVVNGVASITANGATKSQDFYATSSTWTTNLFYFKAGSYCQDNAGNSSEGSKVSFYQLSVSHPVAPVITNQPANTTASVGGNASFNVTAGGSAPLIYRWRFNVTNNIPGGTNASMSLTNVQTTNAGGYTVVITNAAGAITSAVATLTVNLAGIAPVITNQPVDQTVLAGSNGNFTVVAGGTVPLNYQWYFSTNTPLHGATNNSLTIVSAQATNAGSYFVVVTNSFGAVTSMVANLSVTTPTGAPARLGIVTQPAATLTAGVAASLNTQPVIEVLDVSGNTVSVATNPITVAAVNDSGTLSGVVTVAANGSNGRAAFTNLGLYSTNAGPITLNFSAPGLISTNSQPLTVNPTIAVQLSFVSQPVGGGNGQPLFVQPIIKTADRFGNPSTLGLPGSLPIFLTNSTGALTGLRTNDLGTNFLNGVWACTDLGFTGNSNSTHVLSAIADPWSFGKAQLRNRWSFNGNLGDPYGGADATFVGGTAVYSNSNTRISLNGTSTYLDLGQHLISGLSNVTVQVFAARTSSSTSPSNLTLVEFGGRNLNGSGANFLWLSHKIGSSGAFAGAQASTNFPGSTNFWASHASTLSPLQYGHVAVAFDPVKSYMRSWLTNTGVLPGSAAFSNGGWPLAAINDTNCFVGRHILDHTITSTFSQIDVDEVRIWEGLLDDAAITNYVAAGADQVLFRNVQSAPFWVGPVGRVTSIGVAGFSAAVGFAGIAGYLHEVQRSTNLSDWVALLWTNPPPDGLFGVTDTFSDLGGPPAQAYYRLRVVP